MAPEILDGSRRFESFDSMEGLAASEPSGFAAAMMMVEASDLVTLIPCANKSVGTQLVNP